MATEIPQDSPWKNRIFFGVLGVVVSAFVVGWAVIMGNAGGGGPAGLAGISGEMIGFTVQGETSIQLTFQIRKPKDALVTCKVKARADDGLTVGRIDVQAAAGKNSSMQMITLPTARRATTAEIEDCTRS